MNICVEGHATHIAADMALALLEQAAPLAAFIAPDHVFRLLLVLGCIEIVAGTFLGSQESI